MLSKEGPDVFFWISIAKDNLRYIPGAKNPTVPGFSKHVDLEYTFLVDHIITAELDIYYVLTNQMIADIFTKKLKRSKLKKW